MNKSQVISSKDQKARKRKFNTAYLFIGPYAIIFLVFVVLLILISFLLSFAYYDGVNMPHFIGLTNYITLFTQDLINQFIKSGRIVPQYPAESQCAVVSNPSMPRLQPPNSRILIISAVITASIIRK